jgi:hypothetical protein
MMVKTRGEVGLGSSLPDCLGQDSLHGAPQHISRPALAKLLLLWQCDAELDQSSIEKWMARLEGVRARELAVCFEPESE